MAKHRYHLALPTSTQTRHIAHLSSGVPHTDLRLDHDRALSRMSQKLKPGIFSKLKGKMLNRPNTPDSGTPESSERTTGGRVIDGTILLTKFVAAASESSSLLGPLKAASIALGVALETVQGVQEASEDWDALIKRLKYHIAVVQSQTKSLEEDDHTAMAQMKTSKDQERDEDHLETPKDEDVVKPLTTYIGTLEEIVQELSKTRPKEKSKAKRTLDVKFDKGVVVSKTREMDEAFQAYVISMQDSIANLFRQTQGELMQELKEIHRDIRDEAVKDLAARLESHTVYGDQHLTCLEGTRTYTLAAIHKWINDPSTTHKIFYLLDHAGSGKSTVSKQVATDLESQEMLFGRFFFSRDTKDTMSTKHFCSTLFDAFATQSSEFRKYATEFKERPDFKHLSFEKQLEGVVINPLKELNQPAVLIVDAVDECNNDSKGRDRLLNTLHQQHSSAPLLRILITGRPEKDIKQRAEVSVGYHTFRDLEGVNKDVERYIYSRLESRLSKDQIGIVVEGADDLFVWARIACDMLEDSDDIKGVLDTLKGEVDLTRLYKIAMDQAMPKDAPSRRAVLRTLGIILATKTPLSIKELKEISPKPAVVENVVARLGSFLIYDDRDTPIRLVHITFRDFITDHSKAGPYFVQIKLAHYILASQCLVIFGDASNQQNYRANMLKDAHRRKVIEILVLLGLTA